jgi:hypothetical protein
MPQRKDGFGNYYSFVEPDGPVQNIAFSGTSAQSAAFNANTRAICLTTTTNCRVQYGLNPTALATGATASMIVPSNYPLNFSVQPGYKLAVINTDGGAGVGFLSIQECT